MTESSIFDASIEDILGGEVDDNIAYESIDADAILGEVDEFLAENAIKSEDKSKLPKPDVVSTENDEEQLDYDEDPVSVNCQSKSFSAANAESDARQRGGRRAFNNNFDDGNYYVNPNFRGPYPPDLMGMPRPGPMYMQGPGHPRFYHGYRGPGPMRYPMGGGPPFGPMMYGPPMGGMGPRGGPYGGPPRGAPGRFGGSDRRPPADPPGKEHKNDKAENNGESRNKDSQGKPPSSGGGGGSHSPAKLPPSRPQPVRSQPNSQSFNNISGSVGGGQRRRTPSPVNRLPTVRIGGSGTASVSSSQTSLVGGINSSQPQQQTRIPTMSNVNALLSASLRLTSALSRPNDGLQPTSSVTRPAPTPLMMLPQNPPPSASIQPAAQPMLTTSRVYPTGGTFIAQQPTVYLDPVRIVPAVAPIVQQHQPIVQAPNATGGGAMDWSLMVDAFVRRTAEADRRPRTPSSRSRSYTRSPSGGRSFSSSSSGSRSRSRSRSPIPKRSPRSPLPSRRRQHNERRGGRRSVDRRREPSETKEDQKRSRECAEAIGLDDDYLRKVEEQKRLRDEFTRQRDQKRQLTVGRANDVPPQRQRDSGGGRKGGGAPERERGRRGGSPAANRGGGRRTRINEERNQQRNSDRRGPAKPSRGGPSKQQTSSSSNFTTMPNTTTRGDKVQRGRRSNGDAGRRQPTAGSGKEAPKRKQEPSGTVTKEIMRDDTPTAGKLKAYLAVVISNIKDLENPYKHAIALSDTVGPTKKVWQTSENKISIIFVKHEHAKQFMLQYHGKSLAGSRLDVSLEKVFLNLTASVS